MRKAVGIVRSKLPLPHFRFIWVSHFPRSTIKTTNVRCINICIRLLRIYLIYSTLYLSVNKLV